MDEIIDWDESTDSWERRHPPTTRADLLAEEEELTAGTEAEAESRAWLEEQVNGRRPESESPLQSLLRELLSHPESTQPGPPTRVRGI